MAKAKADLTALESKILNRVSNPAPRSAVSAYDLYEDGVAPTIREVRNALRRLSSYGLVHWESATGCYVLPCPHCGGGK
jgi:hypothetical protein